jgi:hypothetical protein
VPKFRDEQELAFVKSLNFIFISVSQRLCGSIKLNLHRHAGVSQCRPRQSIKRGNFLRHEIKQTFDARETILAGDIKNQFMQKFPLGPGVAGRRKRGNEFNKQPLGGS